MGVIRLAIFLSLLAFQANAGPVTYENGKLTIMLKSGYWETAEFEGKGLRLKDPEISLKWHSDFGTVKDGVRTVRAHGGGYVIKHMLLMRADPKQEVRLMCNQLDLMSLLIGCASSATMWLNMENVCIGRNSIFHFHGPSFSVIDNKSAVTKAQYTEVMANEYPKELRAEFRNKWSKRSGMGFYTETGAQLKQRMPSLRYCK